jgi:GT2 family glycosyltransferase
MTDVRISVVVPTVGREKAVARCLDALTRGTLLPAEILVVDQSGEARIARVLEERGEVFPNLRHLVELRRGLSAARNAGARAASGDILAFTDDDCVPAGGWLAAVREAFDEMPRLAGVTGPMLPLDPDTPGLVAVSSRTSLERVDHRRGSAPWVVGTGGNMTLRRSWLEHVGGWDERLGVGSRGEAAEDVALVDRVLIAGGVLRYEPEAVVRHEQRSLSARRATRRTYGHGVGASCGILLREGEARGMVLLGRWLRLRLSLFAAGLARGRVGDATAEARVLVGTAAGLAYGVRVGGHRGRLAPHGSGMRGAAGYLRRKR